MLPVVPGPPSPLSPLTAAVRRPRYPQPVDAETEHRGRIRKIEFKVLMYTQLAGLNNQRLRGYGCFKKWSTHLQIERSREKTRIGGDRRMEGRTCGNRGGHL